jgi:hypothetical protein
MLAGAGREISRLPADECAPFENRERCGSLSCGGASRKTQRLASPGTGFHETILSRNVLVRLAQEASNARS